MFLPFLRTSGESTFVHFLSTARCTLSGCGAVCDRKPRPASLRDWAWAVLLRAFQAQAHA